MPLSCIAASPTSIAPNFTSNSRRSITPKGTTARALARGAGVVVAAGAGVSGAGVGASDAVCGVVPDEVASGELAVAVPAVAVAVGVALPGAAASGDVAVAVPAPEVLVPGAPAAGIVPGTGP